MKINRVTGILVVLLILVILFGTFSVGFAAGRFINPALGSLTLQSSELIQQSETPAVKNTAEVVAPPVDRDDLFKPFWQAWDVVHEKFVDQPVDDVALMRGAIQGMLKALGDDHTSYLDPDLAQRFEAELNGQEYDGIGAWVDITGEYLKIISPMPGSPAEKAGLRPGDMIMAIDGEDMTGVDGELVRQRVLGPKGSTVTLTVRREGVEEPLDVKVTRASIVVPTIESKMLENDIAYVKLYTFGDSTARDLRKALRTLLAEDPTGLILDLRNNGGGYLNTAIDVVSEFIPDGVVMYEEYGDGTREAFRAKSGGIATKVPMVVLINEGSASASEIVAGAIQDRQRGQLVGVTSFGKGSVQTVERLVNDQGQIRVTIARWLTPNERQINKVGLEPDVMVEITDEDRQQNLDPQLDKAIEILLVK